MNSYNRCYIRGKNGNNAFKVAGILSILILLILFVNLISMFNYNNPLNANLESNNEKFLQEDQSNLDLASGASLFSDPFTSNLEDLWNFFKTNYKSNLSWDITTLDTDTYYRYGDNVGTITSTEVYPVDTLMLYKTLLKPETNALDTFQKYLDLRVDPLWYEGNLSALEYGFIGSVDTVTKSVTDTQRYLIDNLMPIFLLIENIGNEINTIDIEGKTPKESINEIFLLINSSQFWDSTNDGFFSANSTVFNEDKYSESNLYAVLANLKIRNLYEQLGLDAQIKQRAYELANKTIDSLIDNLWDTTNLGFYYKADADWSYGDPGDDYKYLDVNALGIITLLDYWIETGKSNVSIYIQNAEQLFDKMDQEMWNVDAYYYYRDAVWDSVGIEGNKKDLRANSLMMLACLKLFDFTGNITYYNRALELYNFFETTLYDVSVNAYDDSSLDDSKFFNSNLQISEAYLYASDIFNSTILISSYNVSDMFPDFIFNQDMLNISSSHSLVRNNIYYNTSTNSYESFKTNYAITEGNITYVFKYPNGTLFDHQTHQISGINSTLLYNITDDLPIGDGYNIFIYANSSDFRPATTIKTFNVTSGLVNTALIGIPDTIYQGPKYNITFQINNTRSDNLTLSVSMGCEQILNQSKIVYFESLVFTNVTFNITTKLDAEIGDTNLIFKIYQDKVLYLEVIQIITIGHSFDYFDFTFSSRVPPGGIINVGMNLFNFLPNNTQSFNISFSGNFIENIKSEITLLESEIRTVFYELQVLEIVQQDKIEVEMEISKATTVLYTKTFEVDIIARFEILSVSFPERVAQGALAHFIMFIRNNQDTSEEITLFINGEPAETNINGIAPGDNRIVASVLPTINPYDFETRSYTFSLRDSNGTVIANYYFEVTPNLSALNFVFFYLVPILIPVCIVIVYISKNIKHKMLRR